MPEQVCLFRPALMHFPPQVDASEVDDVESVVDTYVLKVALGMCAPCCSLTRTWHPGTSRPVIIDSSSITARRCLNYAHAWIGTRGMP